MRNAISEHVIILGIDGMDPKFSRKMMDEGKMPNLKKLVEVGAARDDLMMLGGMPTITPPMWTTLATGAYPMTHGITDYWRQSPTDLDLHMLNYDSNLSKAEPLWNVTVKAGKKTLVWHWPGCSWPPTLDDDNLHVVDGSGPGPMGMRSLMVDKEFLLVASPSISQIVYKAKAASESKIPCATIDVEEEEEAALYNVSSDGASEGKRALILDQRQGMHGYGDTPFDLAASPIKEASGWTDAPEDAKEFILSLSKGLVRRPGLIIKNGEGVYDTVKLYKSKKETEPVAVLKKGEFVRQIKDMSYLHNEPISVIRNMRILELKEDGSELRMWVSNSMRTDCEFLFQPQRICKEITSRFGYPPPVSNLGGADKQLLLECMNKNWEESIDFQASALNYLIETEKYDMIFSHMHNVDLQMHMIVKYLGKGSKNLTIEDYQDVMEAIYTQTDRYIGRFMHLLEKDWTILLVSDHALICPEHKPPMIGDNTGVNIRLMQELGFTALKLDENGNELPEIDWSKTKALAVRSCHIYLNIKGRDKHGIVDPKDKYEIEEEIITALYEYKHPETGKRVVTLAVRNKDAVVFGLGGPDCGDIIFMVAEGYNYDHGDSWTTSEGPGPTAVAPIFVAAGKGIKKHYELKRYIREVDVAPTAAALMGVRMPAQSEGSVIHQILVEDF